MSTLKHLTVAVPAALVLGACSMMPTYDRPDAPIPAAWPQGAAYEHTQTAQQSAAEIGWREFFRDPALQRLIDVALENNMDLRRAALNVEAFRALYRIQRSELYPGVGVEASGARQRLPADLSPTGEAGIVSDYGVTVGMSSYEIDFFGRVRSLSESALQTYLASEEAQRTAHIGLVGDVALAYLTWRTDREQLGLAHATLNAYEESLRLMELRADAGVASGLDVRQARTLVHQARTQVARYTRLVAEDVHGLQLLLGANIPADLPQGLPLSATLLADVPAGLPSDVLQWRPDIRAAERLLRAANADIGAARAAFFPSISLTAGAGTASAELSGLFNGGSGLWSFVPQINLPIFTAGRLSANLNYAEVSKDIRVAEYERSIQSAFREVADGLAARGTYGVQLAAQRELVVTTEEYYVLAQQRYDEGVSNFLQVLDARRNLYAAQQQLLNDRLAQLSGEVLLYKALGGGWQDRSLASATEVGD